MNIEDEARKSIENFKEKTTRRIEEIAEYRNVKDKEATDYRNAVLEKLDEISAALQRLVLLLEDKK